MTDRYKSVPDRLRDLHALLVAHRSTHGDLQKSVEAEIADLVTGAAPVRCGQCAFWSSPPEEWPDLAPATRRPLPIHGKCLSAVHSRVLSDDAGNDLPDAARRAAAEREPAFLSDFVDRGAILFTRAGFGCVEGRTKEEISEKEPA